MVVDGRSAAGGAAAAEGLRGWRGSGPSTVAQWAQLGGSGSCQPGEWTATTVGVRDRVETPPLLGQAVLIDDHQQWSGAAAADQRRGRRGSGPSAVAQRAQPGGSGSGSARRIDNDDSRGMWLKGDTSILGQAVLVDEHPQWSGAAAADQRRWRRRRGSGPSAVAQPGGGGSGSARRMDSGDSRGTWSNIWEFAPKRCPDLS
jgi:hypothetical protein